MKTKFISVLLSIFTIFVISSCSNDTEISNQYSKLLQENNAERVTSHRWFYFTEEGFKETDIPHNVPIVEMKPWTEATRITSSITVDNTSYVTVNKLGILESPETFGIQKEGIASDVVLVKDVDLFSPCSVGDLFYINNKICMSFFINQIFSDTNSNKDNSQYDTVLALFDTESYTFNPVVRKEHLIQNNNIDFEETEIREVFYDNVNLQLLLKSNLTSQTDFKAITASINLDSDENPIRTINNQTVDHYRNVTLPKDISVINNKIIQLLSPIPDSVTYLVDYYENNSFSTTQYQKGTYSDDSLHGYVQSFDHCSIALFEDGTLFFAGKLPSQKLLNNGKSIAFTLPNLGEGFVYSNMSLSGSTLLVGWEEKVFYETGRSGFLVVDMEEVLYEN